MKRRKLSHPEPEPKLRLTTKSIRAKKFYEFSQSLSTEQRHVFLYLCDLRLADVLDQVEETRQLISIVRSTGENGRR